jgi:hypothetical protein
MTPLIYVAVAGVAAYAYLRKKTPQRLHPAAMPDEEIYKEVMLELVTQQCDVEGAGALRTVVLYNELRDRGKTNKRLDDLAQQLQAWSRTCGVML